MLKTASQPFYEFSLCCRGLKGAFFVPVCVTWLPGIPGDSAWAVSLAHGDLLGFLLRTGVSLGCPECFWELLIGMFGCLWLYLVLSCYFLSTAVSGAIIISLFAITPLQVLAIQRKKEKERKRKRKKNSQGTHYKDISTRPQNYVQCKLTEDTSLHCQMWCPKLGCFTVYLLGRKRVTMILNSNIIIQFTVGLVCWRRTNSNFNTGTYQAHLAF